MIQFCTAGAGQDLRVSADLHSRADQVCQSSVFFSVALLLPTLFVNEKKPVAFLFCEGLYEVEAGITSKIAQSFLFDAVSPV
jgi:hypothetical protein